MIEIELPLQTCSYHEQHYVKSDIDDSATSIIRKKVYRQVSNIRRTLMDNKIVDHSDVIGASPVGAAPTTSSFST